MFAYLIRDVDNFYKVRGAMLDTSTNKQHRLKVFDSFDKNKLLLSLFYQSEFINWMNEWVWSSGCGCNGCCTNSICLPTVHWCFFVQFISSNWNAHTPSVLFVNIEKHAALLDAFFCAAIFRHLQNWSFFQLYYFVTCIVRVSLPPTLIVSE